MRVGGLKDYGDTNFITGMRALAAFGVLMIHSGGAGFRALGAIGNNIADLGRTGVYVFFVISGFSVAASFESSASYFDYLNKRIFRIAPLYYFWIVTSILLFPLIFPTVPSIDSFYNIFMHVTFLGFLDYRITNSIIGVEWSIPIEVFWYFWVPLMVKINKRWLGMGCSLILSWVVYRYTDRYPIFLLVPLKDVSLALSWSPIPYVLTFSLGIVAYRLRGLFARSGQMGDGTFIAVLLLLALYVARPLLILQIFYNEFVFVSLLTFALLLFGSGQSAFLRWALANRVMLFLGGISYGIYLSHCPLMGVLGLVLPLSLNDNATVRFLALAVFAVLTSTALHYVIEQPGLVLGRRFYKRASSLRNHAANTAQFPSS